MNDLELPPTEPADKRGTHFLVILILCYGVSFAGSEGAMRGLGDWYPALARPSWAPAMALFVPLWTVCYGGVAVAAWQVWESTSPKRKAAMCWLIPALVAAGLWPWLFFSFHLMAPSAIEGGAVWLLTGLTVWAFARVRISAGLLLVPFWTWTAYLAVLAFAVSHR